MFIWKVGYTCLIAFVCYSLRTGVNMTCGSYLRDEPILTAPADLLSAKWLEIILQLFGKLIVSALVEQWSLLWESSTV